MMMCFGHLWILFDAVDNVVMSQIVFLIYDVDHVDAVVAVDDVDSGKDDDTVDAVDAVDIRQLVIYC